jgi:hypothetical protein
VDLDESLPLVVQSGRQTAISCMFMIYCGNGSQEVKIFAHMLKKVAISFPIQASHKALASQNPVKMTNFVAPERTCSGS